MPISQTGGLFLKSVVPFFSGTYAFPLGFEVKHLKKPFPVLR